MYQDAPCISSNFLRPRTSDNDNDNDGNHGRLQMKVPKHDTAEGHLQLNMVLFISYALFWIKFRAC